MPPTVCIISELHILFISFLKGNHPAISVGQRARRPVFPRVVLGRTNRQGGEYLGLTIKRMAGKESACRKEILVAPTFLFALPDTRRSCRGGGHRVTRPTQAQSHGCSWQRTGQDPIAPGPPRVAHAPEGPPRRNPTRKATEGLPNPGTSPHTGTSASPKGTCSWRGLR